MKSPLMGQDVDKKGKEAFQVASLVVKRNGMSIIFR